MSDRDGRAKQEEMEGKWNQLHLQLRMQTQWELRVQRLLAGAHAADHLTLTLHLERRAGAAAVERSK